MASSLLLGSFDGLHSGHLTLFSKVEGKAVVLLIDNIPSRQSDLLYTVEQRVWQLENHLNAQVKVYDVIKNNISALAFFQQIIQPLHHHKIIVGSDFKFGCDKRSAQYLQTLFKNTQIIEKTNVSSTLIRQGLKNHQNEMVNSLLVEPYYREGEVIYGTQRARQLGFPTANIVLADNQVHLPFGSYVVGIELEGEVYQGVGFVSLKKDQLICETHIFNFDRDIYGKQIKFVFLKFIRPIEKFANKQSLQTAIAQDVAFSYDWFNQTRQIK